MVDTADLKSVALKGVPVRVRPAVFPSEPSHTKKATGLLQWLLESN
ncbi:MAG: hypothetical protein RL346_518, partial [Verrucomicrobiota bacterium]